MHSRDCLWDRQQQLVSRSENSHFSLATKPNTNLATRKKQSQQLHVDCTEFFGVKDQACSTLNL